MDILLTPLEIRVLGCLIEKEATTPDTYPLSLNALTTACNQKTNRDPVMELDESTVLDTVEGLVKRGLTTTRSGAGSRVSKYAHRLTNRLLDDLNFSQPELAVLAVLFLRGPQTPGELRARSARLHRFQNSTELMDALGTLEDAAGGPYVVKLATVPGQKEARYAHLFSGEVETGPAGSSEAASAPISDESARVTELEHELARLRKEFDALRAEFDAFVQQF